MKPTEEYLLTVCPSMPVVTCAGCPDILVSERTRRLWPVDSRGLGEIFVTVKGRPVCRACFIEGGVTKLINQQYEAATCYSPRPTPAPDTASPPTTEPPRC